MTDAAASGPVKTRVRIPRRAPPVRRPAVAEQHAAVRTLRVQPMLRVGPADDPAEREAEAMAERVVSMSAPAPVADATPAANTPTAPAAGRASAEDQPSLDSFETAPPILEGQEDVEVPPKEDVDATALEPGDMQELESGAPEDTGGEAPGAEGGGEGGGESGGEPAGDTGDAAAGEDQGEAQLARDAAAPAGPAVGPEGGAAPADVAAQVAQPGAGRPLPAETRAFMEPRFGVDFSDVRLHDAPEDRRAAKRIGARAFTLGRRIWLGEGETPADRRLMAHELTHVMQQTNRAPTKPKAEAARQPVTIRRGIIADEAEGYARQVPGYTLLSVILGKSPITGNKVTRNAENLIGGFMGLLPGGTLIFDRLKETRVLQRAYEWVSTRLSQLNITWTRISRLIDKVWDVFPTFSPLREVKKIFRPLVDDIKTFIGEIKDKILEFIVHGALKLAGRWGEKVWEIIQQARQAISLILDDPLGFVKNLIGAVMRGFGKFKDNIWDHLKRGLMGWLFGAIATAGIQMPDKLDFKGLLSLGLQILGLTYDKFRAMLVKRLGKNGERKVAFLEKSVEVVKILVKDGFLGLWQKLLSMIDGFKQKMIGGLRDLVITSVIRAGVVWLAGLANPIGGVIKICLAIYDMIVVFLERLEQIKAFVGSIFSSVSAIARGQVQAAGDFIERTLGAAVPLVISFLAAIMGLNTIPQKIRKLIETLRKPIKKALDRMLKFLIKKSKKLLSKLVSKLNSKRKLPGKSFKIGKKKHTVFAKQKGRKVEVMVASPNPMTLKQIEACMAAEKAKLKDDKAKKETEEISQTAAKAKKDTKDEIKRIDLKSENKNMRAVLKELSKEIEKAANAYDKVGKDTDGHPELDTTSEKCLIRAQEPRNPEIEGTVGKHKDVKKETDKPIAKGSKLTWSTFYESDHVIEKQFPKEILRNLGNIDPRKSKLNRGVPSLVRTSSSKKKPSGPVTKDQAGAKSLGNIGKKSAGFSEIDEAGNELPAIAIHRGIHKEKAKPLVAPNPLLQSIAKTDDPHGELKKGLSKEFAHEVASLRKLYGADKSAPKDVVKRVGEGLEGLLPRNKKIYGFDVDKAASDVTAANATAKATPRSQSTFTFSPQPGEANRPDFIKLEGRGVSYSARNANLEKFGHIIQYDHVIEKDFPNKVREFSFDKGNIGDKVREKAKTASGGALKQPGALAGQTVVKSSAPMHTYAEENGYTIPISKRVHDLTIRGSYGVPTPASIANGMPDGVIEAAAQALNAEDDAKATAAIGVARTAAATHIKAKFAERTKEHSTRIADGYAEELSLIATFNPPEYVPKAQKAMAGIASNVAASLREAESRTVALVGG